MSFITRYTRRLRKERDWAAKRARGPLLADKTSRRLRKEKRGHSVLVDDLE